MREKTSYEKHVEYGKNFSSVREYNKAKKPPEFYSNVGNMRNKFPNNRFDEDCGWCNPLRKKSYEEHVNLGMTYKSYREYNKAKKSPDFYADVRGIIRGFEGKNFPRDCEWT